MRSSTIYWYTMLDCVQEVYMKCATYTCGAVLTTVICTVPEQTIWNLMGFSVDVSRCDRGQSSEWWRRRSLRWETTLDWKISRNSAVAIFHSAQQRSDDRRVRAGRPSSSGDDTTNKSNQIKKSRNAAIISTLLIMIIAVDVDRHQLS